MSFDASFKPERVGALIIFLGERDICALNENSIVDFVLVPNLITSVLEA